MSQTSFTVPQSVRNNAKRGLELRRKHGRGGITNEEAGKQGIGSGVQRASDLMSGSVSEKTVRRMHAFFARHSAFKKYHKDKTSAAYISWLIWGGDAGKRWANSVVRRLEATQKSMNFVELVKVWSAVRRLEDAQKATSFVALVKAWRLESSPFEKSWRDGEDEEEFGECDFWEDQEGDVDHTEVCRCPECSALWDEELESVDESTDDASED